MDNGWVTAANVLVPGPWFPEVVRWARNHSNADFGIQIDLNSDWNNYRWRPISNQAQGSGLLDLGGYLPSTPEFVARHATSEAVEIEAQAQIELARNAGIPISHIDDHMRAMWATPAFFETYWKLGQEYDLPVTLPVEFVRRGGAPSDRPGVYTLAGIEVDLKKLAIDRELELMPGYAQKDWLAAYEKALGALPPGTYLLSVHLGFNDEELQAMTVDHPNWGAQWRQNDFDVIRSLEFQKFLKDNGFILVGWKDLEKRSAEQKSGAN